MKSSDNQTYGRGAGPFIRDLVSVKSSDNQTYGRGWVPLLGTFSCSGSESFARVTPLFLCCLKLSCSFHFSTRIRNGNSWIRCAEKSPRVFPSVKYRVGRVSGSNPAVKMELLTPPLVIP